MEAQTIVAAIRGDAEAFYELINLHKHQLYRIAFRYLKSEQDALEAIQEMTYRAYRSIHKLKEPKYFQTWLIRILINACNDELKRLRVQLPLTGEVIQYKLTALDDSTEPGGRADLQRLDILEALDRLDLRYRQVIELKYFEDLTIQQIAVVLERPEGTIKTWLFQSFKLLKEYLQERGDSHV
ncbi:sigma-70 family RNA polymerase sigma factor [Desulfosporosinus nitroreducens]|uniref:sigma-70 family RNA polymerase sigma factor n=1 Tax=Desulfosporosinus nitroreducens TaxID=2018668 RepID=UPI00207C56B0|nr:sigma-70 family RNA polymerase sigma factor [Desulfosporosinus nitroreducens]MCO1604222.1 sigma-70 family RNA polymerase sigma factor [Desulfosporosinus nitroreducens]